ncbi:MAG: fused MFS/spermidine synthase [Myxococcaceae bacterium]|nr:fused MFS/spermidine synthase [Myxococcaceae bacterium]
MRRVRALEAVFFATGFASLLLQVVWQRLISLHAGVDLVASTTVVAAFMAGLGLGNLLGGALADRRSPRAVLGLYAASAALVGVYGLISPALLYDGYRAVAPSLAGVGSTFAFNLALLAVPTTLMGVSMPLLARGVVTTVDEAAHRLGRLYAINTLGAALGAGVSGWYLLGTFGFVSSIRLASACYLLASVVAVGLWRVAAPDAKGGPVELAPALEPRGTDPAWPWYAAYAVTGAVALGLEVVFLRLVDALMRSNAYTFAHVLTLYLVCFALGSAAGARVVKPVERPGQTFLRLQLAIGATALLGLLLLVHMPVPPVRAMFESYFASDGYLSTGPAMPETARAAAKLVFVYALGPVTVMGLPVFLMGLAYPFVQAEVSRELSRLGRGTGRLLFANIVGNVAGTLLVSFVLLDALGSAGTLRLLAGLSVGLGLVGVWLGRQSLAGRRVAWSAVAVVAVACVAVFPSNERLWRFFHAAPEGALVLVEERACVNAWVTKEQGEQVLFLNATSQNGWPYDDFHVVIGIVPSLVHPSPKRALAVGLGAGSTAWGLLQDERLASVECVEICGGEIDLVRHLATARGSAESRQLLEDPRSHLIVGDGRKHLLAATDPWDVITVDAMRPNGASAGNVYSEEFYELVAAHLAPGGLFAQWVPTPRVLETVKQVFPHVVVLEVPGGRGEFLLASDAPVPIDRASLAERIAARGSGLREAQRASVRAFVEGVTPRVERAGGPKAAVAETALNSDLFPRDEYFLNR